MPYWMLFGHAFFYDQIELFYHPFKELATFGDIFNLQGAGDSRLSVCIVHRQRRPLRRCRIRR